MNNNFLKRTSAILGLTASIVAFSNLQANAEINSAATLGENISTNATELQTEISSEVPESTEQKVAQVISPGRATRGGSSYIGIGGNIGLGGETTLSEGSFAVFSKLGLTNNLSVRPAALIGDNTVILVPLTVDFPVEPVADTTQQQLNVAPYIGGGAAISTGRDSTVGFLISGGIDAPLTEQFTATAGVNVGFIDETEVGLLLGVGYNF